MFYLSLTVFPTALHGGEARTGWQAEWEKTVEEAAREGQINFYTLSDYKDYVAEFQKKYPKIKVNAVPGRGADISSRILTERRAGKYLVDVFRSGDISAYQVYSAKALQPIGANFILPEVKDESKWWQGKHHYQDPEGKFIFAAAANVVSLVCYNQEMVKPSEFKSYWDFLDPKWKGKIVAYDPRAGGYGGTGARFFYYHPGMGPQLLTRLLAETDIALSRDRRQSIDWLATKKYAINLFCYPGDVLQAHSQGLPVGVMDTSGFKEGAILWPMTIVTPDKPPHPNAAKVFLNWLLSREGQAAVQREGDTNDSLRIDIPKNDVLPDFRRKEGGNYVMIWKPEWIDMNPVLKTVGQSLGETPKK
jgi:iron(III) transport system substrate-binding protein